MTSSRARITLYLLLLGASADLVLRKPPGIGLLLVAIAGTLLLVLVTRPQRVATLLIAIGVAFTAFAAVRTAPWLLFFDLATACTLAVLGASFALEGVPATTTVRGYVLRLCRSFLAIPEGARALVPAPRLREQGRLGAIVRTGAIATVVFAVFASLLISADPVFARIATAPFQVDLPMDELIGHLVGMLLAALAAATTVRYAARTQAATPTGEVAVGPFLAPSAWSVVLGSVVALFTAFVVVQIITIMGGHDAVLSEIGLTYAEYAHQGYTQMIAATVLSLALIAFAWVAGGRGTGRMFRITAITLVALNLVILVSAFDRLRLYEEAFGWTVARLLGQVGVLWLAGFLGFVVIALLKQRFTWLATAGGLLALALLACMNVSNPEAFIASQNLERFEATGDVDMYYLSTLSEDAVPAIIASLPAMPAPLRKDLTSGLAWRCNDAAATTEPWYAANLSRTRAEVALQPYC